jgi:hypothetical protein
MKSVMMLPLSATVAVNTIRPVEQVAGGRLRGKQQPAVHYRERYQGDLRRCRGADRIVWEANHCDRIGRDVGEQE